MNKQNYKFYSKQINPVAWQIYVTNKDKVTFGTMVQSREKPTNEQIFQLFLNKNGFKENWFICNINEDRLLKEKNE